MKGNHGYNRGIVIQSRAPVDEIEKTELSDYFTRSEITTRISFGNKGEKELSYEDPSRLHISVHGAREFFPKEWRKLPLRKNKKEIDRQTSSVREEFHVSLRYIDGKYDDLE